MRMGDGRDGQSVRVTIGGEEYLLRANVEADYTLRCARLVDERLREVRARAGALESHKAAILAALSLADDLFRLEEELKGEREAARRRLAELTSALERALEGGEGSPRQASPPRRPPGRREAGPEATDGDLGPPETDPQTRLL